MARPKKNPPSEAEIRLLTVCGREGLDGLSDLATAIEVSPETVSKWIQRNSISPAGAVAIARRFNVSFGWLVRGIGSPDDQGHEPPPPPQEQKAMPAEIDHDLLQTAMDGAEKLLEAACRLEPNLDKAKLKAQMIGQVYELLSRDRARNTTP